MLARDVPLWIVRAYAFAFGALFGSFANVVVYRYPLGLSVVKPPSHCYNCKKQVAFYDNLPIVSWLVLRGKCRHCKAPFSVRYAMVEALFGFVALAIADRVFTQGAVLSIEPAMAHVVLRFTIAFVLMVAAFIDLDTMYVPHWTKWFAALPLAASALPDRIFPHIAPTPGFVQAIAGAAGGYLGLRILFIDGLELLFKKRGMGLGDAELLLVIGALLGPAGVAFTLGAASVQGTIATLAAFAVGKRIGPSYGDQVSDHDHAHEAADAVAPTDPSPRFETEARAHGDAPDGIAATLPAGPRRLPVKVPFGPFLSLAAIEYLLGADVWVRDFLGL